MFKSIYLVLEYCETDLVKILKGMEKFNASFELGYIKHLMFELQQQHLKYFLILKALDP